MLDSGPSKKRKHCIPSDIQSEIMKRLPVKSLLHFRSVSRQWKSLIDSPKFINNYHVNNPNPRHHLLVRHKSNTVETYTSIIDNNTFPQQKFPLTAPESLSLLRNREALNAVDGLLCFYGDVGSKPQPTEMAVIWNPTVMKSVGIVIPVPAIPNVAYTVVGFGVCRDTSDPKLVKISVSEKGSKWEVDVFKLSRRLWKNVYTGAPFRSCNLECAKVFVNRVVYFRAYLDDGVGSNDSNLVISFDFKSEIFGEVCLPERLVHRHKLNLYVAKVNESLGLLEYYDAGDFAVCDVWMRKDGADKPFTKIYTVKVDSELFFIIGFRNNGDVVMELDDDDSNGEYTIGVYEPSSGHINDVGINGNQGTFYARSYTETLLLLDQ